MKIFYSLLFLLAMGSYSSAQDNDTQESNETINEPIIDNYAYAKMCYSVASFSIFLETKRVQEQEKTKNPVLIQFQKESNTVFTDKTAIIDNKEVDNPLYGKKILFLNVMREGLFDYPFVVTEQNPSILYLVGQTDHEKRLMYASPDLKEIVGAPYRITYAAPLVDIKTVEMEIIDNSADSEEEKNAEKKSDKDDKSDKKKKKTKKVKTYPSFQYIVASVEREDTCSGFDFALLMKDYTSTTTKEIKDDKEVEKIEKHWFLKLVNEIEIEKDKKSPALVPYEQIRKYISINNGLDNVAICDSFWDASLHRLYLGLHIITKSDATMQQGAKAVIALYVDNDQLQICPIAHDDYFFNEKDSVIGAVGPNKSSIVKKIRTLHTSTRLPYLIVAGGASSATDMSTALRTVYSLPLLECYAKNNSEIKRNPLHGSLASLSDKPIVSFDAKWLTRKRFSQAANQTSTAHTDQAIMVGGMPAPGIISDIRIAQDIVFVSIEETDNGQLPGIFRSVPIFDENGCIATWTNWQRVSGITNCVSAFTIDPKGPCIFLDSTNKTVENQRVPTLVNWFKFLDPKNKTSSEHDLSIALSKEFVPDQLGVAGLFDFSRLTELHNDGFLVATGLNKVVIVDPKLLYRHIISDQSDAPDLNVEQERMLLQLDSSHLHSFVGQDLEALGIINAAAIVNDGQNAWLVVGGTNGIAVLMDEFGNGFPAHKTIDFDDLKALQFKKIGNYRLVKKLIGNLGNLYVLSHHALERIVFDSTDLAQKTMRSAILATNKEQGALFDVAISGSLALLATGKGLFVNDSETNVVVASTAQDLGWKHIDFGSNQFPAYKLIPISTTGLAHDFAYNGGQVYVLVGSKANNTSIYRLFIKDVKYGIHDDTVQLVNDSFKQNEVMPYLQFNAYWNNFYTDGLYSILTREEKNRSLLVLFDSRTHRLNRAKIQYQDLLPETISPKQINAIIQDSSSGRLLIAGDFGLSIH